MESSVDEAVDFMRRSPDDAAIQLEGLQYLVKFLQSPVDAHELAVAAWLRRGRCCIEAVVAAMKAHAGVVNIQDYGCGALFAIALADENQPKVAAAGCIEAVVAAMKAHAGIVNIQEYGCGALFAIVDAAENKPKVAAAGGIEVVVAAVMTHASSAQVLANAGSMLRTMAETPAMRHKVVAAAAAALRGCPARGSAPTLLSNVMAEAAAAAAAAASALLAEEEADAAKAAASQHKSERKKAAKQRRKVASGPQRAAESPAGGTDQPLPASQPATAPTPASKLPSPQLQQLPAPPQPQPAQLLQPPPAPPAQQPLPSPPPPQTQTQPLAAARPAADCGGLQRTVAPPATVSPKTPAWLPHSFIFQMEEDAPQPLLPLQPPQPC